MPPAESGQIAPEPFEALRRAEFVFEPFVGSLLQLPESGAQAMKETDLFPNPSPLQIEIVPVPKRAETRAEIVCEKASAEPGQGLPKSAIPPLESLGEATLDATGALNAVSQSAVPLTDQPRAKNKKSAKHQERARFYQPETVRFFNPLAAAAGEDEEGTDPGNHIGPRPSTELSAELKAAIWQIDEQFRQRQKEQKQQEHEKAATKNKRGFLRSRLSKTAEAKESKGETRRNAEAPTSGAGWKEVEARVAAALGVEREEKLQAAVAQVRKPALRPVVARLVKSLSTAERQAPPVVEAQMSAEHKTAAAIDNVSGEDLRTRPIQRPLTVSRLIARAGESLRPAKQETAQLAERQLIADRKTTPDLPTLAADDRVSARAANRRTGAKEPTVEKAGRETKKSTKAEQTVSQPKPQVDERVRAKALAISQVRLEDLRAQRDSLRVHVLVEEGTPEVAKENPPKRIEQAKPSLPMLFQKWLGGNAVPKIEPANDGNRRGGVRKVMPGLVVFCYNGGTPRPQEIVNISMTGFYLRTEQYWSADTMVKMTLQKPSLLKKGMNDSISVLARVVRVDEGGVAHEFVTTGSLDSKNWPRGVKPDRETDRLELYEFLGAVDTVVPGDSLTPVGPDLTQTTA